MKEVKFEFEKRGFTPAYRNRLEELEKALLGFRRAVGTALTLEGGQQQDLEIQIGILQFRIIALADAGDISVEACRDHARQLSKLSKHIDKY